MPQYTNKHGQFVSENEARENGILKDGFTVRVPMLLADSGPNTSDADRVFADSDEGRVIIARARMVHDINRPGEPFTDTDATAAIRAGMAEAAALSDAQPNWKREADLGQARADAARFNMIAEMQR